MESSSSPWCHWPRSAALIKALHAAASLPDDKRVAVTSPFISSENIGDPMDELARQHNINRSSKLNKEGVSANGIESSLKMFAKSGCWQQILDTTSAFLCAHGQGPANSSSETATATPATDTEDKQPTQGDGPKLHHTHKTLQVWLYRSVALWKLRMYATAFTELSTFGSFDQMDLCYEYYPSMYPDKKGSMVPFSLRVIRAELPAQLGQVTEALDQLCVLKHMCQMALKRLDKGLDEDGNTYEGTPELKQASQELWTARIERLDYGIGNCLLGQKEYELAMEVFESIYQRSPSAALANGLGRIALLLGDSPTAQNYFLRAETEEHTEHDKLVHRGLVSLSAGDYTAASDTFQQAWDAKKECTVAGNNHAVCQLYMGLLGDATTSLAKVLEPTANLQELLVFNLCTLYELQSSSSVEKKQALVPRVVDAASDAFDLKCLKLSTITS
eukprot:m.194697 g.194697  ORF g.194697 m.194697 type:complete len:446 (-) comp18658_c0_seq1:94-1431(-)